MAPSEGMRQEGRRDASWSKKRNARWLRLTAETRIDYLERVLYQLFQLTERLLAMGKGKDGD